jgi:predicted O-methyltransferase YrrM
VTQRRWDEVDEYLTGLLVPDDPALDEALAANAAAGLPAIDVSPTQGKLLQLIARILGARAILELGTLGGYSTIWLARGLPADGRLITLEVDPRYAEVAGANIARAGVDHLVELRVGPAIDSLAQLAAEGQGPFDLIFIDADKVSTPEYFTWALELSHPGTLVIVDNVIRDGEIIDGGSNDPSVQGMRRFFDQAAAEPRAGPRSDRRQQARRLRVRTRALADDARQHEDPERVDHDQRDRVGRAEVGAHRSAMIAAAAIPVIRRPGRRARHSIGALRRSLAFRR